VKQGKKVSQGRRRLPQIILGVMKEGEKRRRLEDKKGMISMIRMIWMKEQTSREEV